MENKKGFRNIFLLGSSSFLNDVGSEAITPIAPFYALALGGNGVAVGLISGLREGVSSLFQIVGGWLSDRFGKRKPLVFFGYLLSVVFKFFMGIAGSWQWFVAASGLERFGKLRDAPRDVIITNSSKKKRGRNFGFHQMMDRTGAVLGTLLAIFLFWQLQLQMNLIILIAAGVSVLSIVPLFFVKDKKTTEIKKNVIQGVKELSPKLKYFIFVASVFAFANFGLYLFLLLRVKDITGSVIISLIVYAGFNLLYALLTIPFGILSDKIGRKKVLTIGYILFFVVAVGLIFVKEIILLTILFALYGIVYAITQSNQRALVSDISGEMKGTALGFYYSVTGIATIIGGLIAGILWDLSYTTMFIYISAISLVSVLLLIFVNRKAEKRTPKAK